jgi:hypothetical protein
MKSADDLQLFGNVVIVYAILFKFLNINIGLINI